MEVGDRVYVIRNIDADGEDRVAYAYGPGVYQGEAVPPIRTVIHPASGVDLGMVGETNPKIELDSGETVWGAEVWWGPEEAFLAEVMEQADRIELIPVDNDLDTIEWELVHLGTRYYQSRMVEKMRTWKNADGTPFDPDTVTYESVEKIVSQISEHPDVCNKEEQE